MSISVTILVKNGARTLRQTLSSLALFEEVILLDTGSQDETLTLARHFPNVLCFERPFEGFGVMHNQATSLAKNDWILSIDADETLSPELVQEILSLHKEATSLYSLLRENYFNGKKMEWCGWQKERCIRLYHRKQTRFSDVLVHEGIERRNMKVIPLKAPLRHTPYLSISDFLRKMEHYSTLFAQEKRGKKRSSPWIAFTHGVGAFVRSFFLKKGFLGGYEGFLISAYNGHTAFYKYLKLYHANRDQM